MSKVLGLVLGAVVLLACAADASADTMFDLSGPTGTLGSSTLFTVDGVTIQVVGTRSNDTPEDITQSAGGIGLHVKAGDNLLLDSLGPNEQLDFTIAALPTGVTTVVLEMIGFNEFTVGTDGFRYGAFGSSVVNNYLPTSNPWNLTTDSNISVANQTFGLNQGFRIRAVGIGGIDVDFWIASLEFSGTASPVPEPASALLVACGAGAFLLSRRRRR